MRLLQKPPLLIDYFNIREIIVIKGVDVGEKKDICIICAYRENCQKRFSLKAGQKCLEFARDLLIKEDKGQELESKTQKK